MLFAESPGRGMHKRAIKCTRHDGGREEDMKRTRQRARRTRTIGLCASEIGEVKLAMPRNAASRNSTKTDPIAHAC